MPIPHAMEVHPQILIFAGSLVAIFLLAGLAVILGLGGMPVLAGEEDAARLAGEVVDGYEPTEIALDRDGKAALARDSEGRIMLIKRHGNKFAGRLLNAGATARIEGEALIVASGERRYGDVTLQLTDARTWAEAINRLHSSQHA